MVRSHALYPIELVGRSAYRTTNSTAHDLRQDRIASDDLRTNSTDDLPRTQLPQDFQRNFIASHAVCRDSKEAVSFGSESAKACRCCFAFELDGSNGVSATYGLRLCTVTRPYLAVAHFSATEADDEVRVKPLDVFRTFTNRC